MAASDTKAFNVAQLSRVLGMLGSENDNEALTAARLAHRMVHQAGLQWSQVLRADLPATAAPSHRQPDLTDARGRAVVSPVGASWRDLLLWLVNLVRSQPGIVADGFADGDLVWLGNTVRRAASRSLTVEECRRLLAIYDRVAPRPEGRVVGAV